MGYSNVPVNGWPQIKDLEKMDAIAQQIAGMPTFTSNDKAFLEDLPAYPDTDGTKVLTAITTSGTTVLSWEAPSGGFNLPMPCAYGNNSGIGSASNEKNYWFGIWASNNHEIPIVTAGSNCTVTKIVDNSIARNAFALYTVTKTNAETGASISTNHVDASGMFGISDYYNVGEFTKVSELEESLQITTNKPILLALHSAENESIYSIVSLVNAGIDNRILRCQYNTYANAELHVVYPQNGAINLSFTHGTSYAYAEISENE